MSAIKRFFTKKNATQQFLLTYALVLIPVMLVSFLVSSITLKTMQNREYSVVKDRLSVVSNDLQNMYDSYRDSAVSLEAINELTKSRITSVPDGLYEGIAVLKNTLLVNRNLHDVAVYHGTKEVFSAKGRSSLSVYFSNRLLYPNADLEYAEARLTAPQAELTLLRNATNGGYVLMHYPGRTNKNSSSYNFVMSLNHFLESLSPLIADTYPSYVTVTFANGERVHLYSNSFGELIEISDTEYPAALDEYTVMKQTTADGMLHLEVLYSTELLFVDVKRGQTINYIVLVVGLLVAALAAWFMSRRQVRQITSLETMLESGVLLPEPSDGKADEFTHVRSMIMRTIQQSEEWQQMAVNSSRTLKQQTAAMIFRGALKEGPFVDEILHMCGLEAVRGNFFLGGIQMTCTDEVRKSILQLLSGDLYYETVCNGQNTILFLLGVEDTDSTRQLRLQTAEKLAQLLQVLGATQIRIALSRVYSTLERGGLAGMEVTTLLENMPIPAENDPPLIECTSFKERTRDEAMAKITQQVELFRTAIDKHDANQAIHLIHDMDEILTHHETNDESARYLRYCMLQPLMQAVQQVGTGNQALLNSAKKIDPSNATHFAEQMVQLVHDFCAFHGEQDEFEKIVDYIEENYHRDNLTQEEVAEYVGLSRTSLSKLFRAKAGTSYIDYITELRMRKAKELLLESDLPIAEVFQRVGYVTRSNYTKKFKDYYGVNASDVRKNAERLRNEEVNKTE